MYYAINIQNGITVPCFTGDYAVARDLLAELDKDNGVSVWRLHAALAPPTVETLVQIHVREIASLGAVHDEVMLATSDIIASVENALCVDLARKPLPFSSFAVDYGPTLDGYSPGWCAVMLALTHATGGSVTQSDWGMHAADDLELFRWALDWKPDKQLTVAVEEYIEERHASERVRVRYALVLNGDRYSVFVEHAAERDNIEDDPGFIRWLGDWQDVSIAETEI